MDNGITLCEECHKKEHMENSKISWCDHTTNLWWGCTKVHEGCDNCYAEALSNRYGDNVWGNDVPRKEIKSAFKDLNKFQNRAKKEGRIDRVFVGSMMDIFEKPMPLMGKEYTTDDLRGTLFHRITIGLYPNLMFLFLTKRPSNINKYIPIEWKSNPPSNVMFGTSVVNQATADRLVPQLLKVNGSKFLSLEPQLDSIDLNLFLQVRGGIDWVIQGGESGNGKRPFNLDWAYDMEKQCKKWGVPFMFKQIDKVQEIPSDLMIKEYPELELKG